MYLIVEMVMFELVLNLVIGLNVLVVLDFVKMVFNEVLYGVVVLGSIVNIVVGWYMFVISIVGDVRNLF